MFEPPTHHNGIKVLMNSQKYFFIEYIGHDFSQKFVTNVTKITDSSKKFFKKKSSQKTSERGYLVCTLASCPGVPGSNPIAAPKSCKVYPSSSGLLSFNKPETVLWTIAKIIITIIIIGKVQV